ncbi:DegT/DnrJ/EryC1/StrS aminotransferase family protein, partial [Candidatus Woesearchaeota archaeon]|nr:DegT/DnrJ/EryC1/StrS aminotransferase family protein [Candidatus Woesearchaeota archaeon]
MEKKSIPVSEPFLNGNEENYVLECVRSSWISSLGKFIPQFEEGFAKFCSSKYGVAVMNGTVALQLALAALGIKEGDEVIVPDLTFVATANAVKYLGAKPVFVDSEIETWNIDTGKIASAITKKTKAIIPVHLYGHPCDMDAIMQIAKKHSLFVIEDAAEAHGAEYKGKRVGSIGDVGCFSFYGNKIITTGEGGMCITGDSKLAERMHFLKD